jgi:hypothetical protein
MPLIQPESNIWTVVIWILLFLIFPIIFYRISYWEILFKLEAATSLMERRVQTATGIVLKKISKKPKKELKQAIRNFLEFFSIEPVSLDPFGIVRKFEHIVNLSKQRFRDFVKKIAPNLDEEEQANLMMGLSGAISLNQVAKILRHYTELVKKTKSPQLAMVLQMNVPLIERVGKALLAGTEALTKGWPIGDSIGCLVAAKLIGKEKTTEIEEDIILAKRKMNGKKVYILKSKGPGGRIGKIGRAVEKIIKREKVAKVITIDAAAKLEGEKTGSIAEGVGVAIGGIGIDRAFIEEITTKKAIPLDSVIIKMSSEEAIMPMKREILNATDKVCELVKENIARTKGDGVIIVVGVGNSCGVGNDERAAEEAVAKIKKVLKVIKRREEKKKKFKLF